MLDLKTRARCWLEWSLRCPRYPMCRANLWMSRFFALSLSLVNCEQTQVCSFLVGERMKLVYSGRLTLCLPTTKRSKHGVEDSGNSNMSLRPSSLLETGLGCPGRAVHALYGWVTSPAPPWCPLNLRHYNSSVIFHKDTQAGTPCLALRHVVTDSL